MKHLKTATALFLILIFCLGATVEPGLKIWQYPNRPVPSDTAFFVLSEGGVTYNVSMFQLRSKITNSLATVNYVNGLTNSGVSSNYVVQNITNRVFVAPGSTNVGIVTNYANGTVTYAIYVTNNATGGGDQVWTNSSGTLIPVSTNAIGITPDGSITNNGSSNYFAGDIYGGSSLILSTNLGDPAVPNMVFVGQGGFQEFWIYDGTNYVTDLFPSTAANTIAYTLGTSQAHTSGLLAGIYNGPPGTLGNYRFGVDFDGNTEIAKTLFLFSMTTNRVLFSGGQSNVVGRTIGELVKPGTGVTVVTNNDGSETMSATVSSAITGVWSNGVNVANSPTNLNFIYNPTAGVTLSNGVGGKVDVILQTLSATTVTQLVNNVGNSVSNFAIIVSTNFLEHRADLAFSDTNVIVDIQSANAFRLTLTTNALIIITNWPATPLTKSINIDVIQGAPGSYKVFYDSHIKWSFGMAPVITTNEGAIDVISMRVGPYQTNFNAVALQFFQ